MSSKLYVYAVRIGFFVVNSVLFFALLLHSIFYSSFSLVSLNRSFHGSSLTPLLESEKDRSNVVLLDAVGPSIVNAVVGSGSKPGSHHCFSSEPPQGIVSGTTWLEVTGSMPIAKEIVHRLAQTQDVPIEDQVAMGVQYFDIRVSFVNGDLLVDHGVVYGHAADLFPRLTNAMSKSERKGFVVDIRGSFYNPSGINETISKARELFIWAMNGAGLSPTDVKIVHSRHADIVYEATTSNASIAQLVKENREGQPVAAFVTFEASSIIKDGSIVLISALICAGLLEYAMFYVSKHKNRIEEEAKPLLDNLDEEIDRVEKDVKERVEKRAEREADGRGSGETDTGSGRPEI